jgi:hypothetical protein
MYGYHSNYIQDFGFWIMMPCNFVITMFCRNRLLPPPGQMKEVGKGKMMKSLCLIMHHARTYGAEKADEYEWSAYPREKGLQYLLK